MFATRTSAGSGAAVTHTECGPQRAGDAAHDDRVLLAVLVALEQLLAEVLVDRRIGAPPRGAGERDGGRPLAVPAHQQLGAGRDERAVAAADREHVAGRERLAEQAEHGAEVVVDRGVDLDLARQHDLLELAGADPLHRPRHRLLVMRRRHRAEDLVLPRRRRVEQRQRRRAELGEARRDPRLEIRRRVSSGATSTFTVSATRSPPRASDSSGTTSDAGANPCHRGEPPPSGANANPPSATRPEPGGPSAASASADAASADQRLATVREPIGAARLELPHRPDRRHRVPVAVGLLEAEPRFTGAPRGDRDRGRVDARCQPGW